MTPTLIVPGPAQDWLPLPPTGQCRCTGQCHGGHTWSLGAPPAREWVPVTTLPEVIEHHAGHQRAVPELGIKQSVIESPRPLRAGDTVRLATHQLINDVPTVLVVGDRRYFATAKVAEVLTIVDEHHYEPNTKAVEVTDQGLVLLHEARDGAMHTVRIDLPGAQPGGWAVRLANVEALSGHVDSAVTPEEAQALRVESINERHARLRGES